MWIPAFAGMTELEHCHPRMPACQPCRGSRKNYRIILIVMNLEILIHQNNSNNIFFLTKLDSSFRWNDRIRTLSSRTQYLSSSDPCLSVMPGIHE